MNEAWRSGVACINGEFTSLSEARLPIMDSGFLMGVNVYDSVSLYEGYLFRVDASVERFFRSLHHTRLKLIHRPEDVEHLIIETAQRSRLREGVVNMIATRGIRRPDLPIEDWQPTLIVMAVPPLITITPGKRASGYRMCICSIRNVPPQCLDPRIKNYNRLFSYLATLEAHESGFDDAIMLDLDGYVTEGPNYNVFAVRDGVLYTPDDGILMGVTRDTIIRIAQTEGLSVVRARLLPYDLYNATEAFITSTLRGALGLVELDNRTIGNGSPGPITTRLNEIYWKWHTSGPYGRQIHVDELAK